MSDNDKRGDDQIQGTPYPISQKAEAYLVEEAQAEYRSEFYSGIPHAMAGGSPRHSLIIANIIGSLHAQLGGRGCDVYDGNLKIYIQEEDAVFYPDVSLVCGEPELLDAGSHAILNPSCVFEVLSESTAVFDKGRKFLAYQRISSLQTYVLVHQQCPKIEIFKRLGGGHWSQDFLDDLEQGYIRIDGGVSLALSDIYRRVKFGELGHPWISSP